MNQMLKSVTQVVTSLQTMLVMMDNRRQAVAVQNRSWRGHEQGPSAILQTGGTLKKIYWTNMSGIYSVVQARIRESEPLGTYVHCAAHNLNLVLNDSVKNVPEISRFYDTIEHV